MIIILITGATAKIWVKNVASERIQKTKVADKEKWSYLSKGKIQNTGKEKSEGKSSSPFPWLDSSG